MVVDTDGVITLVNLLVREEQIQATVKNSFKGSAMAGSGAFMGGIMGGPVGLLAGGLVGSIFGYMATKDCFVSLPEAVNMLPDYRKELIAAHVQRVIDQLDVTDLAALTSLAISASNGGASAVAENIVLRSIVNQSIDYIRQQVQEEQRANPNYMLHQGDHQHQL